MFPKGIVALGCSCREVEFADTVDARQEEADAAVVSTEWDEFRALDLAPVKAAMAKPMMVDLRNVYPVKTMKALGVSYACVGRGLRSGG
jgi:UDPglucose 6-dehydrogenase